MVALTNSMIRGSANAIIQRPPGVARQGTVGAKNRRNHPKNPAGHYDARARCSVDFPLRSR